MSALDSLLAAVAAAPSLPGASCRGHWDTFDGGHRGEDVESMHQRHALALRVCQRCPELGPCREWFDGLSATERPTGVVAGQRYTSQGLAPLEAAS